MRLLFLFILCTTLFVSTVFAQDNFTSGYILSLKGDTIRGTINYQQWDKNPTAISFKTQNEAAATIYSSRDIKGFFVNDSYYKAATVTIDTSAYTDGQLSYSRAYELKTVSAFLLTLVSGEKSLFYLKDGKSKIHFFITGVDGTIATLNHKRFYVDLQGRRNIVESKEYVGQLKQYLNDCSDIESKIDATNYTWSGMVALFKLYYNCRHLDAGTIKVKEKTKTALSIIGGVSLSKFNSAGSNLIPLSLIDKQTSASITGGVGFEIFFKGNGNAWSLINEAIYNAYTINHKATYTKSNDIRTNYDISFGNSFIKINNMLRYTFGGNKISWYLNAGIANGVVISTRNRVVAEDVFYTTTTTTTKALVSADNLRKIETSILFGVGVGYKKYAVQVRNEMSSSLTDAIGQHASTNKIYLVLSYGF
ncbi:outer membrane beta-barrel protein [Mucilaginibacter auburnensis]|uniref:Outer membrane protein with beta-barrel domain n=1 Tax=Mucilaginibacter auburnensis TaxID=1457233 RepID=A0A2H9VRT2_9SPHI|nr:outer membrane beta-barrel protein [Mucilaginibacter auburnensis]PJJ83508.1 hypothetical protein CLV57_0490 [Mucilaginibacter auburnensis]